MLSKSSISAGADIRAMLSVASGIKGVVTDIFPIIADEAILPYITYRCAGMDETAVKTTDRGPDRATYEVTVYAADYDQSVEIAEAVREALTAKSCGLVRAVRPVNHSNGWAGDAYYQLLTFQVRTVALYEIR